MLRMLLRDLLKRKNEGNQAEQEVIHEVEVVDYTQHQMYFGDKVFSGVFLGKNSGGYSYMTERGIFLLKDKAIKKCFIYNEKLARNLEKHLGNSSANFSLLNYNDL